MMIVEIVGYVMLAAGTTIGFICNVAEDEEPISIFIVIAVGVAFGIIWPVFWSVKITQKLMEM